MTREEFITSYKDFAKTALNIAAKARRTGLLDLEKDVDQEEVRKRHIFYYGLRFVVDGVNQSIIDKILSNIIEQESDDYSRRLKTIQKEAVLSIQDGFNPQILRHILNSYTDLPLNDDEQDELLYEHEEGKYDGEV